MKIVKLIKNHIHAGVSHIAGDVITVSDADADFIVKYGAGELVKTQDDKKTKKAKNEQRTIESELPANDGVPEDKEELDHAE